VTILRSFKEMNFISCAKANAVWLVGPFNLVATFWFSYLDPETKRKLLTELNGDERSRLSTIPAEMVQMIIEKMDLIRLG